jgi:hypothetical protein
VRSHTAIWSVPQRAAWNLAVRMETGIDQVLRFVDDTHVPFTNNLVEGSLRMVNIHDKISGTFRSADNASALATIRSYIQTGAPMATTVSTSSTNCSPPDPGSHPPPSRSEQNRTMSPKRPSNQDLDELIEEITVDCHDHDEQLGGFETAFDNDATLPCPGTIIGQPVEVLAVATADGRAELIATIRHDSQRYKIALLDITLDADPTTTRLLAAYRRWTGT